MRGRFRTIQLVIMVCLLLMGTTVVQAQDIKAPSTWSAAPLHVGLAASYATLQALDVVSTVKAVGSNRGQEVNPMLGNLAEHPVAFAAVKGGVTLATTLMMRRYAKEHPKAAAITMIGLNIGYAYIVSSNFRIASGR